MKKSGSAKNLIESQKLCKISEEKRTGRLRVCSICGGEPERYTIGIKDMGATLPIPNFKCSDCGIVDTNIDKDYMEFAYPEEWIKAEYNWNKVNEEVEQILGKRGLRAEKVY